MTSPESKHRTAARKSAQRKNGKLAKMAERIQDAGDLPEPPSTDHLLRLLGVEARNGHVPAIRLLLEEYRRNDDSDSDKTPLASVDELAERRAV